MRGVGVVGLLGRVGVGGFRNESRRRASGGRGEKEEESNDQHGGKVWRFEAVEGNEGISVDSLEESLGMKDIDGNGVGCVDKVEDRIMLGNCGIIVGTEDRRVVVVEDCRTRGFFKSCSHAGESQMRNI